MAFCQWVSMAWCHRDLGERGSVDGVVEVAAIAVVAAAGVLVGGSAVGL